MQKAIQLLKSKDFLEMGHWEHFGSSLPGVYYAWRHGSNDEMEYVSLVSYEGKFVEAVYEKYLVSKNTRVPKSKDFKAKDEVHSDFQKRGFLPVEVALCHGFKQLEEFLK